MPDEALQRKVRVEMARLAFARIWKPGAVNPGDRETYNCILLLGDEKDPQVRKVARAINEVGAEKWKNKWNEERFRRNVKEKSCLRDQGTKDYEGFEEGCYFVSCNTVPRPLILDANKEPLAESDGRPYSGCYVDGLVQIWAQDNQWGKRVNAQLLGLQFRKDGEPFTGGGRADVDDFDDYSDESGDAEVEEYDDADLMG